MPNLATTGEVRLHSVVGASPQPSWSPTELLNLEAWYDGSNTASITASGGSTSQWSDLSGNGFHLVQGTGSKQPTTGTRTINGLNALDFVAADQQEMATSSATVLSGVNTMTLFVVFAPDSRVNNARIVTSVAAGGSDYLDADKGIALYDAATSWSSYYANSTAATFTDSSTGAQLITSKRNGATWSMRRNGVAGTDSGSLGTTNFSCGVFLMGHTTENADGLLGEVLVYNTALSAGDITTVETYLNSKWAVF